jgi:hypothetical protein
MKKTILLFLTFALFGCDQSVETVPAPVASFEVTGSSTGIVAETINVESYSYIRINQQDQDVWLASNPITVAEGDVVRVTGENVMKDFYSKTLDRTFPTILFVGQIELIESNGLSASEVQVTPELATNPHANMQIDPATAPAAIEVQALEGGKTVAGIFAEKEQIEGQEVSLRAQVTKFSPNILGKNWITLQDGTGTAPDNTLVVTSSETVEIGDEVVVKGLIKNNVDIGAGYAYKVILEEASFTQ